MKRLKFSLLPLLLLVAGGTMSGSAKGQGILMSSSGPINRSMGGAAVAAPLDAIGAIRWNPATISALPTSELGFGVDLIWPLVSVDSSVFGGAFAGSTSAESGVCAMPTVGWSHQVDDSAFTIGLGVMGIGGFRTNYPASVTNPILFPQSNTPGVPGGFGRVFTAAQFLDVTPTIAVQVTDRLALGVSPILTLGEIEIDPLFVAPPDDADGSGAPRYPIGSGTKMSWGAGVQLGAYFTFNDEWRFGAALRSPTWMSPFEYQSTSEVGLPRSAQFHFDLPLIASAGLAYAGLESTLIALDVRYFDYSNASGAGDSGFNADGSLLGLGWESVLAVSLGAQYQLTEALLVRGGYSYNQNPTPESQTTINVAAPLHYQHQLSTGGSYLLRDNVSLNAAYTFYFPHSITGPIVTPAGAIPGSSVTSREHVHIGGFGITVGY